MRRFFVSQNAVQGKRVVLSGTEAHHLRSVLRLQAGDAIELFDGTGSLYQAELSRVSKNTIEARITAQHTEVRSDPFPLTLGMAVLKGKKMDLVLQKAAELGVERFIPTITRYSEQQKNLERRLERWQRISLEACKQCGRLTPMQIFSPQKLKEIKIAAYPYPVLCWENEEHSMIGPDFFTSPGQTLLLIGPEGGFHEDEIGWACEHKVRMTTLGPLVLRAETAAIAGVGIIQYLCALQQPGNQPDLTKSSGHSRNEQ